MKEKDELVLVKSVNGTREEVARVPYDQKEVILAADADELEVVFKYGNSSGQLIQIGPVQNLNIISDEISGLFNGPYVGMYVTSNGLKSKRKASFDWFDYQPKE
jgi:alpha-N-arabinofuranosidase